MYGVANRMRCYYYLSRFGCLKKLPVSGSCIRGYTNNKKKCLGYVSIGKATRLMKERNQIYETKARLSLLKGRINGRKNTDRKEVNDAKLPEMRQDA